MVEQKLVVISLLADKNRKDLSNKEDHAESYRYDITGELEEYLKEGWLVKSITPVGSLGTGASDSIRFLLAVLLEREKK
jgi:hypothetical protein